MDQDIDKSTAATRALGDYWTAFCAILLLLIVVYAVFTAN